MLPTDEYDPESSDILLQIQTADHEYTAQSEETEFVTLSQIELTEPQTYSALDVPVQSTFNKSSIIHLPTVKLPEIQDIPEYIRTWAAKVELTDLEDDISEPWSMLYPLLALCTGLDHVSECLRALDKYQLPLQLRRTTSGSEQAFYNGSPLLPPELQDELVLLYFQHIHPLCPAVDEVEFHRWYYRRQGSRRCDTVIFHAMMFAALQHVGQELLAKSSWKSLQEAQKALFNHARLLYHTATQMDEVALTQVALLLSYWSPYDSSKEVNTYWSNRALTHAVAAGLHHTKGLLDYRNRVIWWCCIIRNRLIAFGLRRPKQLCTAWRSGPLPRSEDFGLEAVCPKFSDNKAKSDMIDTFISLCHLSEIMKEVVLAFRERVKLTKKRPHMVRRQTFGPEGLYRIFALDGKLISWRLEYNKVLSRTTSRMPRSEVTIASDIVQVYFHGTVAAIYQPFMELDPHQPESPAIQGLAVSKVKEASSCIASKVGELLTMFEIENIPISIGAWITLPIAVHLVEVIRRQAWEGTMCRFQNLMRLLYGLKIRFEGAQFLTKLIDSVIKTIARKQQECCTPHLDTPDGSPSDSSSHNAVSSVEVEADFLTCVSRLVDLALSNELLDEI